MGVYDVQTHVAAGRRYYNQQTVQTTPLSGAGRPEGFMMLRAAAWTVRTRELGVSTRGKLRPDQLYQNPNSFPITSATAALRRGGIQRC